MEVELLSLSLSSLSDVTSSRCEDKMDSIVLNVYIKQHRLERKCILHKEAKDNKRQGVSVCELLTNMPACLFAGL